MPSVASVQISYRTYTTVSFIPSWGCLCCVVFASITSFYMSLFFLFGLDGVICGILHEKMALDQFEHFVKQTVDFKVSFHQRTRAVSRRTYMTGALRSSTAFHSVQFSGRMAKRVCSTGV